MKMSRRSLILTAVVFFLAALSCRAQAAQGRAVSLRMLEKTLKDGTSQPALTLCGVTRLSGFLVDPAAKDIILVGKVDPSHPTLHSDDLVVALRYAYRKYARREGNTLYYTPPGCSIDPDPAVIRQLQELNHTPGSGVEGMKATASDWETIGRQPQKVRVMGVPFDTHFAKVMVDADYYMKRLSNGSVDLGIDGFTGLMTMRMEQAKAELASGAESSGVGQTLNRFWFCPGEATYEEGDGLVMLRACQVKLLTEEEFLASSGEVKGLGRSSALARQFAESFTDKYDEIAENRPIYKELEGLFRFAAVAGLIREKNASAKSGNPMTYLLSQYKVSNVPVSRMVPGQTRVLELQDERKTGYGTRIRYLTLMSCGGVDMNVRPKRITVPRPKGMAKQGLPVRKVVLASRTSRNSLYWDFALPD